MSNMLPRPALLRHSLVGQGVRGCNMLLAKKYPAHHATRRTSSEYGKATSPLAGSGFQLLCAGVWIDPCRSVQTGIPLAGWPPSFHFGCSLDMGFRTCAPSGSSRVPLPGPGFGNMHVDRQLPPGSHECSPLGVVCRSFECLRFGTFDNTFGGQVICHSYGLHGAHPKGINGGRHG